MSSLIEKNVLSALLDKYEHSSFFREKTIPTRRIMLKFYDGSGKSDFPYYDIEQSERRVSVNRAVKELQNFGYLSFEWMKGEREHIIAKVWLNIDNIESAYQFAERKSKGDVIDEVLAEIANTRKQVASLWFCIFLQDAYDTVSRKRSIVSSIPDNKEERGNLFRAILAIDEMSGSELTERAFSLKYFGDSKKFERTVKTRIVSILKKYQECDDDTRDEDVLRQIGIIKYPEQFEFCGKINLSFGCGTVDFAPLCAGGSIYVSDLLKGELTISPDVKRILSIENRANYIEYIRKIKADDEVVLYHAGQYSPSKKKFFLAIHKAMPKGCSWLHWGDIDFGGFSMLARLRREIGSEIAPFRMNAPELIQYEYLAASVTNAYTEKLTGLVQKSELSDCHECIKYMIKNKVKLEQESMLTDSSEKLE